LVFFLFLTYILILIWFCVCVDENGFFYEAKLLRLIVIKMPKNCDVEDEFWKFVFRPECYGDEVGKG